MHNKAQAPVSPWAQIIWNVILLITFIAFNFSSFCLHSFCHLSTSKWERKIKGDAIRNYLAFFQKLKTMATHSITLAWKIPWTEESGRLQSMGSWRVGYNWTTSFSLFTFMHWRKKWQCTTVFLPGESQGRGSLVGCRLWGLTESVTTEVT